ncbi:phospholipase D family protein [Comamonas sp.]|uniref:phospholipase D family nuclease n=1 Tax=Comamonas sp. TaxID=34028 RepID=UPI0025889444|nr:phospholipase D family protein [Comamonas sp.]
MLHHTRTRSIALALLLGMPLLASAVEPSVQVGFSPEGTARQLVLDTIASAKTSIQVLAYSFQSQDIAQALITAHQRVRGSMHRGGQEAKPRQNQRNGHAPGCEQWVQLRTNDHFHIHHDKVLIVDGDAVETGSFNYTSSAETVNSEKVVVIRGMPEVSRQFIAHWQSRWELGVPYLAR